MKRGRRVIRFRGPLKTRDSESFQDDQEICTETFFLKSSFVHIKKITAPSHWTFRIAEIQLLRSPCMNLQKRAKKFLSDSLNT